MKSKTPLNIETEISRCINQLLLEEPFYAHIIAGTVRKVTTEIDTAAVGLDGELILLLVNELFFLKKLKSVSERIAVLKHEVLHLVFRHLFRDEIYDDMQLSNIAADIVVNQYIGSWKLPDSAVTIETFPDLNLKREETLSYYYDILNKLHKSNVKAKSDLMSTLKTASESAAETKSESENENGTSTSKPMNKKYPMSAQALENIYNAQRHGNHSRWIFKNGKDGKIDKNIANALEQKLSKQLIQAANRTNQKSFSDLPDSIQTIINKMRDELKPKVDWKRQLKIFSTATGRTEIYHTVKRISKRFGTRPGIRIKKFKNLVVVIDTSGSIDENTLIQFFKEIDAIYRNGAQVQIIECDAIVQRVYTYNKKTAVTVQGGGETNYDPAFTYINSNKSLRIDGCIYLTDGYAPEPTVKPRCKLLYAITPMGIIDKHLKWGRIIRIKNDIDFSNIEVIPLNF